MALYSSLRTGYKPKPPPQSQTSVICAFWLKGRCNRHPCRFLHPEPDPPMIRPRRTAPTPSHPQISVCEHWISDSCVYGDKCRFLHSWDDDSDDTITNNPSMLTKLSGHKKAVTGIGAPNRCVKIINNGAEIGCLICEGSWVFIGLPNAVKAWRVNTANNDCDEPFVLDRPIGQVNVLVVYNDLLFAGSEDGGCDKSPLWFCSVSSRWNPEEEVVVFKFADGAIRVWNLEDLECVQTLSGGHSDAVMSLLFWDEYLFSCSLDKAIKIWWSANQDGIFEAVYTHEEQCGVVSLFGMLDAKAKPVLFASCCKDSVIRLYELPSFKLRARLFSRREVEAAQIGPDGLFFLGDRSGSVGVWKWLLLAKQQKVDTQ
ncbi:zinc finger CCCH domain-containing protein 48 [Citrus sinensis]|uniref:Zinc finger CCCH domain-containing protein 48 n=1 Tax=Citrus sinensis TaxID=2711 RepID=A0ACB8IJT6_CITSI|nr:zinc finger CCCH domain-containing protein 48 [Citrus sinensis]